MSRHRVSPSPFLSSSSFLLNTITPHKQLHIVTLTSISYSTLYRYPHVIWSAQAVRDSKIDHTQRHLLPCAEPEARNSAVGWHWNTHTLNKFVQFALKCSLVFDRVLNCELKSNCKTFIKQLIILLNPFVSTVSILWNESLSLIESNKRCCEKFLNVLGVAYPQVIFLNSTVFELFIWNFIHTLLIAS